MRPAALLSLLLLVSAAPASALVGGTRAPVLADPGPGGRRAIALLSSGSTPFCTAWLASPRVAVTAGHCLAEEDDLSLVDLELLPEDAARVALPPVAVERHPTLDVAVVFLGAAPAASLGVEPLAWNAEALPDEVVGRKVEVAGGGSGTPPADGLSFGACVVSDLESGRVHVVGDPGVGTCRGDSGGPYLLALAAPPRVRVIAVESTGAPDCDGPAWGVRTDVLGDWLAAAVARPQPADSEPCGAEGARCVDGVAWRCRGGWWRARDCAAEGAGCGDRGLGDGLGCLPVACGDLDARGACAESRARWCESGRIEVLDCAARGLACGWDEAAGGYRCVPASTDVSDPEVAADPEVESKPDVAADPEVATLPEPAEYRGAGCATVASPGTREGAGATGGACLLLVILGGLMPCGPRRHTSGRSRS